LPRVIQYNKRDLPEAMSLDAMRATLNQGGAPEFEAVANAGRGVSEALRSICKAVLARLGESAGAAPTPPSSGPHTTTQLTA
jgi:hypothetical protein